MASLDRNDHPKRAERLYAKFIEHRRANPPPKGTYTEVHHILPRHAGGTDEPENLIRLTSRDHIVAHLILAMWKGGRDWFAVRYTFSSLTREGRLPTAREIRIASIAREECRKLPGKITRPWLGKSLSEEHRKAIGDSVRGLKRTEETRKRLSQAHTGKTHSEATRLRMREAALGRSPSEETRKRIAQGNLGKRMPEEAIQKVREARAKQPPPTKGMKWSEETKAKMRATWAAKRIAKGGVV